MAWKNEAFRRWLKGELDLTSGLTDEPTPRPTPPAEVQKSASLNELEPLAHGELSIFRRLYPVAAAVLGAAIITVLLITVFSLPRFGGSDVPANNEVAQRYIQDGIEETGAVNFVAGMILDYRAFDTLGESHVLFTGVCAVIILLETADEKKSRKRQRKEKKQTTPVQPELNLTRDPILHQATLILTPVILLFGIYVVLNGHLSPGGGFSGGAILGAGLILYTSAFGFEQTERFMNRRVFRTVTLCALSFYSLAKCWSFYTGANGLESGIGTGAPGAIFSAGLILPLNIAVGAVVACTMYGLYSLFQRGKL